MIGSTISHYRILDKLGEGGMGVVYKAEDTKLERTVALKFLAAHLLNDQEAKQRFLREAKSAAALHHPNICTVHEIDEADGKTFLAMAFLKGETLEERIAKGPLPLQDALAVGRQIAEGLAAAHAEGIVHRDIKPANILVSPEGRATIMDFGLARLTEASKLTRADQTVGTAAYMSPEQIQGGEVDQRTDVWALGCVLYEMVAGVRPFKGQYDQALAYEIVQEDPEPLTGVRAGVPMELEFIVGKCLAKDAADRYQGANEVAVDLRTLGERLKSGKSAILQTRTRPEPSESARHPQATSSDPGPKRRLLLAWCVAAIAILVALGSLIDSSALRSGAPQASMRRFALPESKPVGTGSSLEAGRYTAPIAISPDGAHVAYTSPNPQQGLLIHDLDQRNPRKLEGTEGAVSPFWSPSSELVGYATTKALFKIPVQGGLPIRLCDLPSSHFHGGSFSPDGESIVFSSGDPHKIYAVSSRGGSPEVIATANQFEGRTANELALWPHFLPGSAGRRVLVFSIGTYFEPTIVVQDLETDFREVLGPGAFPSYSPTGHILAQTAGEVYALSALPFSVDTLRPTGQWFPVAPESGFATVARDGTLVHLEVQGVAKWQFEWITREGTLIEAIGNVHDYVSLPALSPDGNRLAFFAEDSARQDLWVVDLARNVTTRLTNDLAEDHHSQWSPDGSKIVFSSNRSGSFDLYLANSDGSGEVTALTSDPATDEVTDWSRDGNHIVYYKRDEREHSDIWLLERTASGGWEPKAFLATEFNESDAKLSPDGHYVAYSSDESGRYEVYVQPFPAGGRKVTVSRGGGRMARWSRDGSELFYFQPETGQEGSLFAASVSAGADFTVNAERRLCTITGSGGTGVSPSYEISLDGTRLLVRHYLAKEMPKPKIHIVENWYEEFRQHE